MEASRNSLFKLVDKFFNRYAWRLTLTVIIGYLLLSSLIMVLRYKAFDYNDWDTATYAHLIWKILHGSMYSSIGEMNFLLGGHMNFIIFLIAPIFVLFPSALTLVLLQNLFIGLSALPIYLLAKDILDRKFAFLFSALFLIYPAVHFISYSEFHPVAFSIFFFLFMFYYFEKGRFVPFICFMVLLLLCKENMSMGVLFFGLYALLFRGRRWKWWAAPLFGGGFWFLTALKIMPHFAVSADFNLLYKHLGENLPEVARNIVYHPVVTLKIIFMGINRKFLFSLFFPLAFLSLLSPGILFIAIPFFLQQLLSARLADHTLYFHYTAKLIPFLFISAIYGTRLLLKSKLIRRYKWCLGGTLLAASIISNINFGLLPKLPAYFSSWYKMKDIDYVKQRLINKIPEDASVVTTFEFIGKLAQRKEIYSFHNVCLERYTLGGKKFILPENVEYALIDFNDTKTFNFPSGFFYQFQTHAQKNLQNFFAKNEWGLVEATDSIALFKKRHKADIKLCEILKEPASLKSTRFYLEDNTIMWGCNVADKKVKPGETIDLSFIWKCAQKTEKDYLAVFEVIDKEGTVLHKYVHRVSYQIYPAYEWKKGDILKENLWILVPSRVKVKNIWLKMAVYERKKTGQNRWLAKRVPMRADVKDIFDQKGRVNLDKIEIDLNYEK